MSSLVNLRNFWASNLRVGLYTGRAYGRTDAVYMLQPHSEGFQVAASTPSTLLKESHIAPTFLSGPEYDTGGHNLGRCSEIYCLSHCLSTGDWLQ